MELIKDNVYQHFKGQYYLLKDVSEHTETGEAIVTYKALYGEQKLYSRPLAMFTEDIVKDRDGNVTGQTTRFRHVDMSKLKTCQCPGDHHGV